jgi:ubiquinone/menaquinone biosynthesis C-methylase UbiE
MRDEQSRDLSRDDQSGHMSRDEQSLSDQAGRAARVYGAAADHYDLGSLSFWDRFGAATIKRLAVPAGSSVLDLCCGAGASAIPAAHSAGPAGRVLAIDVAEPLLQLARMRAAAEGLTNIDFRRGDATDTGLDPGSFDAVVCVFGVFFAADMTGFAAEMWRLVRPGGVLAVTTWGPGLFEPASSHFWNCVTVVEPALFKAFNPWDLLTTPSAVTDLLTSAGVTEPAAEAVTAVHHLDSPDSFWDVVLGSGYRATTDALIGDQYNRLRAATLTTLRERDVTTLQTNVVFATARRPG